MKMTLKQARQELSKLGFYFNPAHKTLSGEIRFGTGDAEDYDVSPNHFNSECRHIYIGTAINGGFYVTSTITGMYRKYRSRRCDRAGLGNIFGHGKTLREAVEMFVNNFKSKKYNFATL